MSLEGFEPLDGMLEDSLRELIGAAGGSTDECVTVGKSPEVSELRRIGYLRDYDEYFDGRCSFFLEYRAVRYFERKARWEDGMAGRQGVANKVASVVGSFIGSASKELLQ